MSKGSAKERIRKKRRQQRIRGNLIRAAVALVVIVVLGALLWPSIQPPLGEEIPVAGVSHVPEGEVPGPFNSDPPTSGVHYTETLDAGFYEESDVESLGAYPEGYLVHNLEHGHVIFWYNCTLLDAPSCEAMTTGIRQVMQEADNFKVVAFPRESIDVPLVMTSWGRMLRLEQFDADLALRFVERNRNKAPEPQAP